jgi:hypothetical protein
MSHADHVIAGHGQRGQEKHHLRIVVTLKAQAMLVQRALGLRVGVCYVGLTVDVLDGVGRFETRSLEQLGGYLAAVEFRFELEGEFQVALLIAGSCGCAGFATAQEGFFSEARIVGRVFRC